MATKQPDKKPQADLQQVVMPIRDANNVLVTINSNPTVDQLASCIGLTLVLNKLGKHATAVFSGEVPSTLEFLKPEETLEKNTDSLRDFIIALDKSKADKLRYKVEDDIVKIFITPYKTSINEGDLDFSQGDFNVDVVVALGVEEKKHLDQAILAHGRILHDATVISVNTQSASQLGSINWSSPEASSLCEMVTDIVQSLTKDILDKQNSTALLTGIVAETERYSNEKATPHTMSIAGALMSAGASTQLVSNELDGALKSQKLPPLAIGKESPEGRDGELDIDHSADSQSDTQASDKDGDEKSPEENQEQPWAEESQIDAETKPKDEYLDHLNLSEDAHKSDDEDSNKPDDESPSTTRPAGGRIIRDPPHFTGQLTANTTPEEAQYTGSTDPLTNLPDTPILGQKKEEEAKKPGAPSATSLQQKVDQTLREIEESVSSPHLAQEEKQASSPPAPPAVPSIDEARKATETAAGENERPPVRQDTGTTQMGDDISHQDSSDNSNPPPPVPPPLSPSSV